MQLRFKITFIHLLTAISTVLSSNKKPTFSDTGGLSHLFTDISYAITVKLLPNEKKIMGSNRILFKPKKTLKKISLDLFNEMIVDSVLNIRGEKLNFIRGNKKLLIALNDPLYKKGNQSGVEVFYHGKPIEAKNAPWDGGFVWGKDSLGNQWVSMACQGLGASFWLPCFDRWDVEPNVSLHIITPKNYTGVSNGRLINKKKLPNGFDEFTWQSVHKLNVYNISINMAKYYHIKDSFMYDNHKKLTLNYYVLQYNAEKAKTHFQQVKRMMQCFDKMIGKYPFIDDGYKLVETPFWGMEHQSCVAYGNNYQYNKYGFDFIIIHESAHEWFGNSITASDPAHFWIHESFTTYMENLYVECLFGKAKGTEYILEQKENIENNFAMVGKEGIKWHALDNDVYYKGAFMLHMLRQIVNNDELWFNTLKKYIETYSYHTLQTKDVIEFFSKSLNKNLKPYFNTYLYQNKLPVIEYYIKKNDGITELHYRLNSGKNKLSMLVKGNISKLGFDFFEVTPKWQVIDLPFENYNTFVVDPNFLVEIKKIK